MTDLPALTWNGETVDTSHAPPAPRCEACPYWVQADDIVDVELMDHPDGDFGDWGWCHRHPSHERNHKSHWCGEHPDADEWIARRR